MYESAAAVIVAPEMRRMRRKNVYSTVKVRVVVNHAVALLRTSVKGLKTDIFTRQS